MTHRALRKRYGHTAESKTAFRPIPITRAQHVGYDHYRVSDTDAGRLARRVGKSVPKGYGHELRVVLDDGRHAWLKRTPYRVGHTLGDGYATTADVPKRGWIWAVMPIR